MNRLDIILFWMKAMYGPKVNKQKNNNKYI